MNKTEIINKLNEYNFDKNEYIILSTASLVLQGIKDKANDIDLAVSPKLYKEITSTYKGTYKETNVYTFDKFDAGLNYFDSEKTIIHNLPMQTISAVLKLKQKLNREKDITDINLINNYIRTQNPLVLAYLGDAIYELYVRLYLLNKGISKVNDLQQESIKYVSAKAQSQFLDTMLNENFLTPKEINLVKRARNHKSHSSKSADIITYKRATGLEALIGYLKLTNNYQRIDEIMNKILN